MERVVCDSRMFHDSRSPPERDIRSGTALQALTLYGEHGFGYPVRGAVNPLVGNRVAPLQGLAVQVIIVGEPYRGPEVVTNVLDAT